MKSPPPRQTRRHVLQGTFWIFFSEILVFPTGLVIAVYLARRLGPEIYGLFVLTASFIGLVEWNIASIFSRAAIKFISEAEDWRPAGNVILRLHFVLSCVAALLLWMLAPGIGRLFHEARLTPCLRFFLADIPIFCLAKGNRSILMGRGHYERRALAAAGGWIARLVFVLLFVGLGFSVWGAIAGCIGSSLVEMFLSGVDVRTSASARRSFPVLKFLVYAAPLFLLAVCSSIYNKLDLFMLKILGATAGMAGVYGVAQNASLLSGIFAMSFSSVLISALTRARKSEGVRRAGEIGSVALRLVWMLLPVAGLIAGSSKEIILLIFGRSFLAAAGPLSVLIFGANAMIMISTASAILMVGNKPTWTLIVTGPMVALAAAGHLLLIPKMGLLGASLVTLSFSVLGALGSLFLVYRLWKIFSRRTTVLRSILIGLIAYSASAFWHVDGYFIFAKLTALLAGVLICFFILGEFKASEISALNLILRLKRYPAQNS